MTKKMYLPGGVPFEGFYYICSYSPISISRLYEIGIYGCRTPEGLELLKLTTDSNLDSSKDSFKYGSFYIPGSRLWIKPNYSSIELGPVISAPVFDKERNIIRYRPIAGWNSIFLASFQFLVSSSGVFLVKGKPETFLTDDPNYPAELYPMTEIRLEEPIWTYPVREKDEGA